MNLYFEELVERTHYFEQFDFANKTEKMQTVFKKNRETRTEETIIEC